MARLLTIFAAFFALIAPTGAHADPEDIDAAARGVARIVLVTPNQRGGGIRVLGHGTGFAVTSKRLVTNAHVVAQARRYRRQVRVFVVPSQGDEISLGRIVDYNASKDLALIEMVDDVTLPPLALVRNFTPDDNSVIALGYPGVVDRALGKMDKKPIRTRGNVSGNRDLRGTRSIIHSADIAGGNSGGPLVDECGRVVGVNNAVTLSGRGEGEFYFAISNSELFRFLSRNNIDGMTTALPCRSLAELREIEDERKREAEEAAEAIAAERLASEERQRDQIEAEIAEERENMMAFAAVLLLVAAGGGFMAIQSRDKETNKQKVYIFAGVAGLAAIGAGVLWIQRPGPADVDDRLAAALDGDAAPDMGPVALSSGTLVCALDEDRSKVYGQPDFDVEFEWDSDGCVNGRTQYGRAGRVWSRVLVPEEEDVVSINTIDPEAREYRIERFLIGSRDIALARDRRGAYEPPSCRAKDAADRLDVMQRDIVRRLPDNPNELLIYTCENRGLAGSESAQFDGDAASDIVIPADDLPEVDPSDLF